MGTQRRALSLALLAVSSIVQCLANAPLLNRPQGRKESYNLCGIVLVS